MNLVDAIVEKILAAGVVKKELLWEKVVTYSAELNFPLLACEYLQRFKVRLLWTKRLHKSQGDCHSVFFK